MQSISEISFTLPKETARSRREALLKSLYELYTSQPEINKKENRKRFHEWIRVSHPTVCRKAGFSKERYDSFKPIFKKAKLPKGQGFVTYLSPAFFAIKMSHIPTDDLPYMISRARDKFNRGECVAQFVLGSIKA